MIMEISGHYKNIYIPKPRKVKENCKIVKMHEKTTTKQLAIYIFHIMNHSKTSNELEIVVCDCNGLKINFYPVNVFKSTCTLHLDSRV